MGHGRGREETKPISTSRALAPVVLMGKMPMLRNAWRRLSGCAGMTLPRTRLPRQTNPILGRLKRRLTVAGEKSYDEFGLPKASEKQSQFRENFQVWSVKCQAGEAEGLDFRLYTSHSAEGFLCETKPISAEGRTAASVWWRTSYGELATETAAAKQSQFRREFQV